MSDIVNKPTLARCDAVQHSDQMQCPCGLAWDMNDPEPPLCRKQVVAAGALVDTRIEPTLHGFVDRHVMPPETRTSTLTPEQAHDKLRKLKDALQSGGSDADFYTMLIAGAAVKIPAEDARKALNVPGRMVVCAAVSLLTKAGRVVIIGPRHYDAVMRQQIERWATLKAPQSHSPNDQGFIDQWGVYMTREEALIVAHNAGQLGRRPKGHPITKLFSEDLY